MSEKERNMSAEEFMEYILNYVSGREQRIDREPELVSLNNLAGRVIA